MSIKKTTLKISPTSKMQFGIAWRVLNAHSEHWLNQSETLYILSRFCLTKNKRVIRDLLENYQKGITI